MASHGINRNKQTYTMVLLSRMDWLEPGTGTLMSCSQNLPLCQWHPTLMTPWQQLRLWPNHELESWSHCGSQWSLLSSFKSSLLWIQVGTMTNRHKDIQIGEFGTKRYTSRGVYHFCIYVMCNCFNCIIKLAVFKLYVTELTLCTCFKLKAPCFWCLDTA
jgi:hypothetical protein